MALAGPALRIAMIGQRGVPATYGGVEHHVEQMGRRLAERGHRVTVFCRTNYMKDTRREHDGMRLVRLPTVSSKYFDAIVHSVLSSLVALFGRYDVVHYHAVGPGLGAIVMRALGRSKVVVTVHALDGERAKWGTFASAVLRFATWASARVPHRTVVVSSALAEHYRREYGRQVAVIVNGVSPRNGVPPGRYLSEQRLNAGRYALFVGRFVPEKAPDMLIRAFRQVPGDWSLVLAGDSSFTNEFAEQVRGLAAADPRVRLPGYVFGDDLRELYGSAGLFVLPSDLEGLPLTLLEAIGAGAPVLASDIAPHREILRTGGPGGRLFRTGDEADLTAALRAMVADLGTERAGAPDVRSDVLQRYCWEQSSDKLEDLYRGLFRP